MTTTTTTITMSEHRSITIVTAEWPRIAEASAHDGQVECQANRIDTVRVLEHADGRRIITATHCAGGGGMHQHEREIYAGFLVEAVRGAADEDATIHAIRRAAGVIGRADLAAECIGDLPAEEI